MSACRTCGFHHPIYPDGCPRWLTVDDARTRLESVNELLERKRADLDVHAAEFAELVAADYAQHG
jgi:hypothetical protein